MNHGNCANHISSRPVAFWLAPPAGPERGEGQRQSRRSDEAPAQHKPEFLSGKITIAKETTRILGPLDKEGHVDYAAAINAECSRGVTPENNAVVKLFEAVGPSEIAAENRNRYFQLLGISPLPVQGPYAISVPEFAKVHGEKGTSPWDAWLAKNFDPATQRPWAAEEFPFVAAWLKANEIPLAKIHDAAGRSRYYGPWVKASPDDPLTMVRFPAAGCLRQCRDLLIARSMLRLHAGQVQDAWADILACHRLARVCGQGPSLVHQIVARNLNGVACQATGILAHEGKLTPDQAARCLNDLDALPPLPRTRDGLDLAERYVFLDVASHVARGGPAEIERCVLIPSQIARGEAKSPARGKEPAVAVGAERNGRLGRSDARRQSLVRSARGRGGKANLAGKIEHVLDFGKEVERGTRSYCRRRRRVEGGRNEPFPRQNRPRDSFPANVRIHGRHAVA